MLSERLEKMGILKHHPTPEEVDQAEAKGKALVTDYLRGNIKLQELRAGMDNLPKLDLVRVANKSGFKV